MGHYPDFGKVSYRTRRGEVWVTVTVTEDTTFGSDGQKTVGRPFTK